MANEVGEFAIENPLAGEQCGVEVGAALQRVPILAQVAARRPNRAEERQDVLQGARPDRQASRGVSAPSTGLRAGSAARAPREARRQTSCRGITQAAAPNEEDRRERLSAAKAPLLSHESNPHFITS